MIDRTAQREIEHAHDARDLALGAAEPADGKAADKKLTGRLFLDVFSRTDDSFENQIIAVEQALRVKEQLGAGEVVVVSLGAAAVLAHR